MYCPNCKQEFDGKFCPECGTKLIEKPSTNGFNINLGDANAISGGINLRDSHDVQNVDNSVHNTSAITNVTNIHAQKTELELLQEKKTLYLNECKRVNEDNVLDKAEIIALEEYRLKIDLDKATAEKILEQVRQMTVARAVKTGLNPIAKIKLKQLTERLLKNEIKALMTQIDELEPLINRYEHDELQRKYYLVLSALKSEKCIQRYERIPADNYWESFFTYLAYCKLGKSCEAEELLATIDRFAGYPEDNITLLAVAGALIKGNTAEAKEFLSAVAGDYTPALQRFVDSIYLILDSEMAKEMGANEDTCAFYLVNFFGQEDPKERARKEAEAKAAEEARRKAEEERMRREAEAADANKKKTWALDLSRRKSAVVVKINKEFVDLGLPSGIKWAKCNIGASSPEEYGNYYAWGEVEPKQSYESSNYLIDRYKCDDQRLDSKDDVANVLLGKGWFLPSPNDIAELVEKCTIEASCIGSVKGVKIIGPNGNSIFLPDAGCYWEDGFRAYARFWLDRTDSDGDDGCCLSCYSDEGSIERDIMDRYCGLPVRAIFVGEDYERVMKYYGDDRYDGLMKDGKENGLGIYLFSSGAWYEGQWKNGNRHGQGTYHFNSGAKHVGEFVDGRINGFGVRYDKDGHKVYEGQWKNGNMHGQGTYYFGSGAKYVGEFADDKFCGFGVKYDKDGHKVYEGQWEDDKQVTSHSWNRTIFGTPQGKVATEIAKSIMKGLRK